MAEQIFSLSVGIQFQFRIQRHHILYEIKISKRNPCLQGVYGNTAVCTQYIVHMQFMDPFLGFFLKSFPVRCKVRIFIAEQLV